MKCCLELLYFWSGVRVVRDHVGWACLLHSSVVHWCLGIPILNGFIWLTTISWWEKQPCCWMSMHLQLSEYWFLNGSCQAETPEKSYREPLCIFKLRADALMWARLMQAALCGNVRITLTTILSFLLILLSLLFYLFSASYDFNYFCLIVCTYKVIKSITSSWELSASSWPINTASLFILLSSVTTLSFIGPHIFVKQCK